MLDASGNRKKSLFWIFNIKMTMNGAMMTLGQSQKKTGKIRGLGGVEGFLFDAPVVWQRETYKKKAVM